MMVCKAVKIASESTSVYKLDTCSEQKRVKKTFSKIDSGHCKEGTTTEFPPSAAAKFMWNGVPLVNQWLVKGSVPLEIVY
jgi:hypothetical protein